MLVGASIINTRLTATLVELDPELIPKECFGGLVLFVLVVCAIEGLVLLLILCDVSCATAQVEQRKQNNESIIVSEKTPLTA
jgi:hypothetical protein